MSSIVIELQQAAMDGSVRVDDLLRKCLVIASKLRLDDLRAWANLELEGYGAEDQIPSYREVHGEVKCYNPYNGLWLPIIWSQKPPRELIFRAITQRVAELVQLASGDGEFSISFSESVSLQLMQRADCPRPPVSIVSKAAIIGVLDSVRNAILNWSLKLEDAGILGNNMTFTNQERDAATGKYGLDSLFDDHNLEEV